jgi:hypothetical protein
MINSITKEDLISNRFAFDRDEEVLVNALELCNEIIAHEKCRRQLHTLKDKLETMTMLIHLKDGRPDYRRINLRG